MNPIGIPSQIYLNTDYDRYIPDEVFFDFDLCNTVHDAWICITFIWEWCKENDIQYTVESFRYKDMRMRVPNEEHRTLMRLTFTLMHRYKDVVDSIQ